MCEFLEARIIPERIEHGIKPEQGESERKGASDYAVVWHREQRLPEQNHHFPDVLKHAIKQLPCRLMVTHKLCPAVLPIQLIASNGHFLILFQAEDASQFFTR